MLETTELPPNTTNETLSDLLDGIAAAKKGIACAKTKIKEIVTSQMVNYPVDKSTWLFKLLTKLKNPQQRLLEIYEAIGCLCKELTENCAILDEAKKSGTKAVFKKLTMGGDFAVSEHVKTFTLDDLEGKKLPLDSMICQADALNFMQRRWDKFHYEFFSKSKGDFDPTKISDIYDCLKHDILHHFSFFAPQVKRVYYNLKILTDFVIPHEYGVEKKDKLEIGVQIVKPLIMNVISHMEEGFKSFPSCRTFLYFTSESHLHALRNTLVLAGLSANASSCESVEAMNINYFSHCVFKLYEDVSFPITSDDRYYINILFSPGAAGDPFEATNPDEHTLPVLLPVPLASRIPFADFKRIISELNYKDELFDEKD